MTPIRSSVLSFATLSLVAGAGCAHAKVQQDLVSKDVKPAPAPQAPAITEVVHPHEDALKQGPSQDELAARRELEAALEKLRNTNVYFDYDSFALTPEGRDRLADVGAILSKHPDLAVRVEGNCDERGTEEYNLQLGQRRAEEARKYLLAMGAKDVQVKTVSYGAERPKAAGHDEEAWKQNRRDDVVVASGQQQ